MTFPDFDPWASFDDDVDDYYQPRHATPEHRKPIMNKLIQSLVRFTVFLGLTYAAIWLSWQFIILLNNVTMTVWK